MLKRFVLSFAAVMNLLLLDQVVKELAIRKLKGAPALEGPWAETDATAPAADFTATNRFFKVEVEMP